MPISVTASSASILPALFATLLAHSTLAQERSFAPPPESRDVKTAPEPSRAPDVVPARPPQSNRAQPTDPAARSKSIDPRAPLSASSGIDRSRTYFDEPGDGSLWARGANYKMSFDGAGATYYPLFGSRQAKHHPHALSPDRVTLGGVPLEFERATSAVRGGDRVELQRGRFVEAYDFSARSIEQTFVFPSIPGAGDLVVHIPVTSDLERRECADAFEFRSDLGRMTYGRATAIDASGRRALAAATLDESGITIHVDAAFLAEAALPLVIDPVVSTFDIDTSSYQDYLADVSYDATYDRWLVVYEDVATAGDLDVYYVMLNNAGLYMWGGYIDGTTASWGGARCANLNYADQFLVVASVQAGGGENIRGRTVQAGLLSLSSEFVISGSESGSKGHPSVGGDPFPSATSRYCVAYERVFGVGDNDILVRTVGSDTSVSATVYLSNSGGTLDGSPSVSRSNDGSAWTVVWGRLIATDYDIWAGRIGFSGVIADYPTQVTSGGIDGIPCVSSPLNGTLRTLVVFERNYGTDHDIQGVVLDGVTAVQQSDLTILEGVQVFQDQVSPYVDSDGQHFLVGYSELYSTSTTDYDLYVSDFYVSGNALGVKQDHVNLGFTGYPENSIRIASAEGSGGQNKRFMAVWDRRPSATNSDILGALFDTYEGGVSSLYCFGDGTAGACPCGNVGAASHGCASSVNPAGASLSVLGSLSTVSGTTVLGATGMPDTSVCLFFQGTIAGGGSAFGDGLNCTGGTVIRIATKTASAGNAHYPAPGDLSIVVRGAIPTEGGTRSYQVWYRNSASFCTLSTFNLTNAARIDWAR